MLNGESGPEFNGQALLAIIIFISWQLTASYLE